MQAAAIKQGGPCDGLGIAVGDCLRAIDGPPPLIPCKYAPSMQYLQARAEQARAEHARQWPDSRRPVHALQDTQSPPARQASQ